jgi:hypothetical protein
MKPLRKCLPSKEREDYVSYVRRQGCTFIRERQTNRYIDEFLRFCSSHSHHSNARSIGTRDILTYAKHLERTCGTFVTARVKMAIVLKWSGWLYETGRIKRDPAEGLTAKELLAAIENRGRRPVLL